MHRFVPYIYFIQGIYFLITGSWALVNMESFLDVTGPKTDLWLVRCTGGLIISISVPLLLEFFLGKRSFSVMVLGLSSAFVLGIIDFYYARAEIIDKVYMFDGILQLVFITGWILVFITIKN